MAGGGVRGQVPRVGPAQLEAGRGNRQCDEEHGAGCEERPGSAGDEAGPSGRGGPGGVVVALVAQLHARDAEPVDAGSDEAEQRGEQGDGDEDRDRDHE